MLVYKNGEGKDILGFICDMCTVFTSMDVIPNEHGEFRYICPKCGHRMKELNGTKEEETKMVNTYTVGNAAKRLNCSTSTVARAIQDGRFHDCFMEAGYHGRPAWMIPSDQVEEWVTRGGFIQPAKKGGSGGFIPQKELKDKLRNNTPDEKYDPVRMIFDPEVQKEVPVLNFLSEEDLKPVDSPDNSSKKEDEFMKRAVKRVAKDKKPVKAEQPKPNGDTDGNFDRIFDPFCSSQFAALSEPLKTSPVVRTDNGFSITIPSEMVEDAVRKQLQSEVMEAVCNLRMAFNTLNEEMKKLQDAAVAFDALSEELKKLEDAIA